MKKIVQKNAAIFVFFGFVVLCSIVGYQDHTKQQELLKLSKAMGVSNKGYPYFPVDYFSHEIKPGMTLDEVHKIVLGYEVVYHSDSDEIYYYFSKDDNIATRFRIMYDDENQYKVRKISGEDENSRTLTVVGWSKGLLMLAEGSKPAPSTSNWGTPIPDWQGIPVMPGAISGELVDDNYIYNIEVSLREAKKFYIEKMKSAGWTRSNYEKRDGGYGGPSISLYFQRDDVSVNVTLTFLLSNNSIFVTLTQTEP